MSFTHDQEVLIVKQLTRDYRQIAFQFHLNLKIPMIYLADFSSAWGKWDPVNRTIAISKTLIARYSWDTVLYVLKHEMAHQIVSDLYGGDEDRPHGLHFQQACELLAVPSLFQRGSGELPELGSSQSRQSLKNEALMGIVKKIEKLFALAKSTNESESQLALLKAQELLKKYNLTEAFICDQQEEFCYFLYDTGKQRLSPVYSHIASLLVHYYHVDVIFSDTFHAHSGKKTQTLEIYGRESHVMIAEYVLQFLLRVLQDVWEQHYRLYQAPSRLKKSFQLGVLHGFEETLKNSVPVVQEEWGDETYSSQSRQILVKKEAELLRHYMKQRHPRMRLRRTGGSRIDLQEYNRGVDEGRHVRLHQGVTGGRASSGVRFLPGSR